MDETRWVDAPTAALMLGVSVKRARNIAAVEKWPRAPGSRPARYSYRAVLATYARRNPPPTT